MVRDDSALVIGGFQLYVNNKKEQYVTRIVPHIHFDLKMQKWTQPILVKVDAHAGADWSLLDPTGACWRVESL
jgi:hypothetical protein